MDTRPIELVAHLVPGVVALATYWIAALARKGSAPHRFAGKVYLLAMVALLVPAIPLSWRVLQHFDTGFGVFLFYLLLITATALWQGWTAIVHKRDFARYTGAGYRRLAWANLLAGAGVLGLGLALLHPIFIGFSLPGLLGGRGMLKLAARGPAHPRWWMGEHLGAMLACGVATHIAFLSIGLPRLLPALAGEGMRVFAWLAPLAIALAMRLWLVRKYLPAPPARAAAKSAPAVANSAG
jgi:hypothetical protein